MKPLLSPSNSNPKGQFRRYIHILSKHFPMATSTSHQPPFPSRPYTSGLSRGGGQGGGFQNTPYNAQTPFNAQQNPGGFGAGTGATTQQQRDAQKLERERHERAEKERREAEERDAMEHLSEEHREEINEAVSIICTAPRKRTRTGRRLTRAHQIVQPIRSRPRQPHRLPRAESSAQSPRVRSTQVGTA